MNQVTIFLFIFGLVTVYSLSDEEIEKVKNLVDAGNIFFQIVKELFIRDSLIA